MRGDDETNAAVTTAESSHHVRSADTTRLTWSEICACHPDETVVLADCEFEDDDESGAVVTAVVVAHGKDRGATIRAARTSDRLTDLLVFEYTGVVDHSDLRGCYRLVE